jgi:hypothetical protein
VAANLRGPVGLRGRVQNVANFASDQAQVIDLLSSIPASKGGKAEAWANPPLAGPNGGCPQFVADAIWDFQSFWKARGVFHNIDGVVDPGGHTLAQLNNLASGGPGVAAFAAAAGAAGGAGGAAAAFGAAGAGAAGAGGGAAAALAPRASPGQWWITSVNTFGLPITAGASVGKIALSLLDDSGDQFVVNGFGGGVGVGVDLELDKLNKIVAKLIELGAKLGDIPNISNSLQQFGFPSATIGIVLKRFSAQSDYTIDDLTKSKSITVTSATSQQDFGGEVGVVTFFPGAFLDGSSTALAFGQIGVGKPWGLYGSVSRGKFALEAGVASYVITSVDKQ